MVLIRDSSIIRRETLYRMLWFRCPDCSDVSLSLQRADEEPADSTQDSPVHSRDTSVPS